jgi:hypothetical protein
MPMRKTRGRGTCWGERLANNDCSRLDPLNAPRLQWFAGTLVTHHLHLLGTPTLESQRLERKTAVVLAYLALEGQTHKYKLSGWLWPDSGETAARNNMCQLLRRLRVSAGEVVLGEDLIELHGDVDVQHLSSLHSSGSNSRCSPKRRTGRWHDCIICWVIETQPSPCSSVASMFCTKNLALNCCRLELLGLIERGTMLAGTAPKPEGTVLPTAILRPPCHHPPNSCWT